MRPIDLVLEQRDLRLGLGGLGVVDDQLRTVGARERRLVSIFVLKLLALPFAIFDGKILPREFRQNLLFANQVTGSHVDLLQKTICGRYDDSLGRSFEPRRSADPVGDRDQGCAQQ